jgi:hypothetical protein
MAIAETHNPRAQLTRPDELLCISLAKAKLAY